MKKISIFLDTNFLIATQISNHQFNNNAVSLLKDFAKNNLTLITTPLVFDEFWYVLRGFYKENDIKKATNNIFKFINFNLENPNFTQKELLKTIELFNEYNLRPRDALIVQTMKILNINDIATFDNDFKNIKHINVI